MGLLRGMARTAVVAGTATAASNRVSRRQQARWATQQEETQQPPTQVNDDMDELMTQLRDLGELRDKGILTDTEFEEKKRQILEGSA